MASVKTSVALEPAARRMADLVVRIPDEMLDAPTPCEDFTLGHLLEHVDNAARTFRSAARKSGSDALAGAPGDGSQLGDDWRTRIPRDLAALVVAWRDPDAWEGMTQAAGVDLPGERAGRIALDELVLHGWDVAKATGQPYEPEQSSLEAVHEFIVELNQPANKEMRDNLFGPVVSVPDDASLLDRTLALTGRDPNWSLPT